MLAHVQRLIQLNACSFAQYASFLESKSKGRHCGLDYAFPKDHTKAKFVHSLLEVRGGVTERSTSVE